VLQHERAARREETHPEALELAASEHELLAPVQLQLEGRAAARAVEDPERMPARAGVHDADPAVLDAGDDLPVELELPPHLAGRPPLLSLDAQASDRGPRRAGACSHGAAWHFAGVRLQDVRRPLAGRVDRLPGGVERLQAAFGLRVAAVQIGMSGPDRVPKGPPNLVPRRLLIDPEKGEQRAFVEGERVYQSV
jgi:hypothetical protein